MDDQQELLRLLLIPSLTEFRLFQLLATFGPAADLRGRSLEELTQVVPIDAAREILSDAYADQALRMGEKMSRAGINAIAHYVPSYPAWLTRIAGFPPVLFMRGRINPEDENALAVIGTRGATVYGKEVARSFTAEFVAAGFTIVSGLARGIDTEAHQSALRRGGRTIAVLGCGLDRTYPPENAKLADAIASQGAVLSEFPLGTAPLAYNFPRRNRIISGLSRAIVAIEAKERSGVMNTVTWAANQGKDVFAIPGSIYSRMSAGTNRLIKEGATPVSSAAEVLEALGAAAAPRPPAPAPRLAPEEQAVWNRLSFDPVYLDELAEQASLATPILLRVLLSMEMRGIVRQLPGMMFVRAQPLDKQG